ncbi:MAG: hypothetical protein KatS3mg087_0496 [Patescibacteria group bacterium]|nr:MAG: hypothetical protein KatS3mg087_0496 [Patescibacteria group bacterium]
MYTIEVIQFVRLPDYIRNVRGNLGGVTFEVTPDFIEGIKKVLDEAGVEYDIVYETNPDVVRVGVACNFVKFISIFAGE